MENNDMNNHSVGLREKLKSIINNAEDMLKFVEVQSLKTFIATVPNTRSFQTGDYMDFDFHRDAEIFLSLIAYEYHHHS